MWIKVTLNVEPAVSVSVNSANITHLTDINGKAVLHLMTRQELRVQESVQDVLGMMTPPAQLPKLETK